MKEDCRPLPTGDSPAESGILANPADIYAVFAGDVGRNGIDGVLAGYLAKIIMTGGN